MRLNLARRRLAPSCFPVRTDSGPTRGALALAVALSLACSSAEAQTVPDGLLWSTYLGGSGSDVMSHLSGACLLPGGDIVVAGFTDSTDFPVLGASQPTYGGPLAPRLSPVGDGFVARLQSDCGRLVWSTYLGGSDEDAINGVVSDGTGGVLVCGVTWSTDFPTTTGAFQQTPQGMADGFVARFAWNGQQLQLLWSTRLGGSDDDTVTGIALHPSGLVVVSGATRSANFPTQGTPYQSSLAGGYDAFVAVLDPTGTAVPASTFVGGSGDDGAQTWVGSQNGLELLLAATVALDHAGNPVLSLYTTSTNFPTTPNAWSTTYRGGSSDCAVVRMNPTLSRLTYGTYLGGSQFDAPQFGTPVVTPEGYVAVGGVTGSANYPTTPGCFQPNPPGGNCANLYGDGCITVLDPTAVGSAQLVYSTFFGGAGCDPLRGLAVDRHGRLLLGGATQSTNLPTTAGAYQRTLAGTSDGFVAHLDYQAPWLTGLAQLRYGTYLGGSCGSDQISDILPDRNGDFVLVGSTACNDFPGATTSPCGPTRGGGVDLVIAKMSLLPRGVERFGHSTPACLPPTYQSVNSWPQALNQSFRLEVYGAPPNAPGFLLFGTPDRNGTSLSFLGIDCFVDLQAPIAAVAGSADPRGYADYRLAIPSVTPPLPPHGVATQWIWTTSACPGTGPFSASGGLGW